MSSDNFNNSDSQSMANKGLADPELKGFSSCAEPALVWQHFYHSEWQEVKDRYFDPPALKNFDQYEHKFDRNLCTPDDMDLALSRMTESLHNQWTKYTSPAALSAAQEQTEQGLIPAGFELAADGPDKFKIEFIHYGSSAQKSDLREGDIVRSVDGHDLTGLTLPQARALQLGKDGSTMQVEAEHEGLPESVSLSLAPTQNAEIISKMLAGGIGYVRLPDFDGQKRIANFVDQLDQLNKLAPGGLKGLILDLRNDPGGDLPNAVKVASLFLPGKDTLVAKQFVRSRSDAPTHSGSDGRLIENDLKTYAADNISIDGHTIDQHLVDALRRVPLTVLINGSSASAAEIVSAALKDNERATLVGTHSFGKGVGYHDENVIRGGVIRIADMKYLTPKGFDLSGKGISPNILIENRPGNEADLQLQFAIGNLEPQAKERG